jgi:UDP-N-acetylmuramoyl-tripeptide--D-alanyl-D-alanine ligase
VSAADVVLNVALGVALALAFAAQMLRWLRVLQREHYEPSSMSRFLGRWSSPQVASAKSVERWKKNRPITLSHVLMLALVITVVVRADVAVVLVSVLYGLFCPQGLAVKGRTSQLQWTRRLKTTALVTVIVALVIGVAGAFTIRPWLLAVAMVWAVPLVLDVSSRLLAPYEDRRAQKFVDQAVARLARVHPRVVAITGSFGKTSTKNHLVDLLRGDDGIVASPRSFNNRAGLSRAINENLADASRVFIAEMGTYRPGEIRALCSWCPPEIAVVTAIGPVHLERMRTLDVIDQAKFEVTEQARTVVLNIDDDRLAAWVGRLVESGKGVRSAGSVNAQASVRVLDGGVTWTVIVDGVTLGTTAAIAGVQPTNLACAIAAAIELGLSADQVMARVGQVSAVANRSNVMTAPSGVVVIDDTFNANPASAVAALRLLSSLALSGRRVVVTPGLIELGTEQYGANMSLGQKVDAMGDELVIVGRTNVRPLETGYAKSVRRFDTRDEAVAWIRSALIPGDGVLYLNDLPDHYP